MAIDGEVDEVLSKRSKSIGGLGVGGSGKNKGKEWFCGVSPRKLGKTRSEELNSFFCRISIQSQIKTIQRFKYISGCRFVPRDLVYCRVTNHTQFHDQEQ